MDFFTLAAGDRGRCGERTGLGAATARGELEARRSFLAHSLGGYAMPRIAARDGKLAGAIFLAGNARPIEDVVLDQNEHMLQGFSNARIRPASRRLEQLKAEVAKVKELVPSAEQHTPCRARASRGLSAGSKRLQSRSRSQAATHPAAVSARRARYPGDHERFRLWKEALAGRKNVAFHSSHAL